MISGNDIHMSSLGKVAFPCLCGCFTIMALLSHFRSQNLWQYNSACIPLHLCGGDRHHMRMTVRMAMTSITTVRVPQKKGAGVSQVMPRQQCKKIDAAAVAFRTQLVTVAKALSCAANTAQAAAPVAAHASLSMLTLARWSISPTRPFY